MLRFALSYDGPVAIRYPRGSAFDAYRQFRAPVVYGKSEMLYEEKDISILSVGHCLKGALQARRAPGRRAGYSCTLVNARFVKPIDEAIIASLCRNHRLIVTVEENVQTGGYGEHVLEYACRKDLGVKVLTLALPDDYVEHGNIGVLRKETGIDVESIIRRIKDAYGKL